MTPGSARNEELLPDPIADAIAAIRAKDDQSWQAAKGHCRGAAADAESQLLAMGMHAEVIEADEPDRSVVMIRARRWPSDPWSSCTFRSEAGGVRCQATSAGRALALDAADAHVPHAVVNELYVRAVIGAWLRGAFA